MNHRFVDKPSLLQTVILSPTGLVTKTVFNSSAIRDNPNPPVAPRPRTVVKDAQTKKHVSRRAY